jgi:hypothetical protein
MMGHSCRTSAALHKSAARRLSCTHLPIQYSLTRDLKADDFSREFIDSHKACDVPTARVATQGRRRKATWGAARPSARRRRADASDSKVDRHRHDLQKAAQTRPSDRRDVTHIRLGSGADPMNTRLESSLWIAPHRPRLPVRTATRSWNCNPDAHLDEPTARPPSMPRRSGGCAASATPTTRSERRWPTSASN